MEPKDNTSKYTLLYNDRKKISIHRKLYMKTVVLIDNESTMEPFCNPYLVEDITK